MADPRLYVVCILTALLSGEIHGARQRPRLRPAEDELLYRDPVDRVAGDQVVLVSADAYDNIYRADDRLDERQYQPREQPRAKDTPKAPPVQTIRNYNKVNDDGSFTFGYEAADGSFKEETRGTDCVVRGKYGYVDPDGNKREFSYVSGNPCDPNKPDEEEQAAPDSAERDDEPANYPSRPPVPRPTPPPRPPTAYFQNDFRDADEDEADEPIQPVRQRVVQRPRPRPRPAYQQQPIAITPRPLPATTPRAPPPATTFRPQLLQITPKPQITYSPTPSYVQSPPPSYAAGPAPVRSGQIDFAAEFAKFQRENPAQSTTASSVAPGRTSAAPAPSGSPIYSTELVYDPSSGQYDTQLFQTLPQTKGELNLNQRLQPYVSQAQPRPFVPSQQLSAAPSPSAPLFRHQVQHAAQRNPQETYQRQQADTQFQNSAQLFAQQQQLQQSQLQRDRAAARAQAQRLAQQQEQPQQQQQFYYVPRGEAPAGGQIDAFLRGHGIQL